VFWFVLVFFVCLCSGSSESRFLSFWEDVGFCFVFILLFCFPFSRAVYQLFLFVFFLFACAFFVLFLSLFDAALVVISSLGGV